MLGPVREMEIAGHHFARADYRTKPTPDDGGLTMFQSQLVTVLHNHAITLSFTTDNQEALDQLAASAASIVFLTQPGATPIPAAQPPAVAAPAVAVAIPPPAPPKPKVVPEVTNGTVEMSFSDGPAPAKPATIASAPAPEPVKSEPVVQTTAQPVTFN